MYDEAISNEFIKVLEQKAINVIKANVALTAQGYVVNKAKKVALEWSSILLDAFENIAIFSDEQQRSIEHLYANLMKK